MAQMYMTCYRDMLLGHVHVRERALLAARRPMALVSVRSRARRGPARAGGSGLALDV